MRYFLLLFVVAALSIPEIGYAQESKSSGIRRSSGTELTSSTARNTKKVDSSSDNATDESDVAWMKVVYRQLDLTKAPNAALYYPEDALDEDYNLFRLMISLLAENKLAAYEYLDGREVFNEKTQLNVGDMLDRFQIGYSEGKGSTAKRPVYDIDPIEIPTSEVLSYYIIERWELDRRDTRMHRIIEAICPVLHRSETFGYEAVKYPMFWMKYNDLRPYLSEKLIFTDDDNNAATSTYDDYFTLGLYDGEIYKTRNLRNKSLMELYPDPDDLKAAQDSIDNRLASFEKNIWVEDPLEVYDIDEKMADETKENKSRKTRGELNGQSKSNSKKRVSTKRSNRNSGEAVRSVRSRKSD